MHKYLHDPGPKGEIFPALDSSDRYGFIVLKSLIIVMSIGIMEDPVSLLSRIC
jgi:hypothetical protein